VWRSTLAELDRIADLRFGGGRRVDAWVVDGHGTPVDAPVPVVAMIHEASWRLPEVEPWFTAQFLDANEAATRESAEAADWVITAAEATAAQIADVLAFERKRISVVAHGVSLVPRGSRPVAEPYVLFAASVHPRKNLAALRAAMEQIERLLVLVLSPAADRADSAELMRAATAPLPHGVRVVDAPGDDALADLMAGADAFVLPSHWEGFGLTALEAMACGAPVIVSDRGALPEVVGDGGLVTEPTPEALHAALRRVLDDEAFASALRDRGRTRAGGFTWERTARGWLEAVEAALEAGPR
jgi:glycosyltransferase involved in cell wall biosynthesis